MAADLLALPADLITLLGSPADLTTPVATMLIELATSKVQGAVGQRIVDLTDTALVDVDDYANWSQWLELPQHPIRSVASVTIDGGAVTDFLLRKQKLWRLNGWMSNFWQPSQVAVVYTHGYPAASQYLQLARQVTLSLASGVYINPGAVTSEGVDDYKVTYQEAMGRMELTEYTRQALIDAYGTSSYVTVAAQD